MYLKVNIIAGVNPERMSLLFVLKEIFCLRYPRGHLILEAIQITKRLSLSGLFKSNFYEFE